MEWLVAIRLVCVVALGIAVDRAAPLHESGWVVKKLVPRGTKAS